MQGVQQAEDHQSKPGKVKLPTSGLLVGVRVCVRMPKCDHSVHITVKCGGACTANQVCVCRGLVMTFNAAGKCSRCTATSSAATAPAAAGSATASAAGSDAAHSTVNSAGAGAGAGAASTVSIITQPDGQVILDIPVDEVVGMLPAFSTQIGEGDSPGAPDTILNVRTPEMLAAMAREAQPATTVAPYVAPNGSGGSGVGRVSSGAVTTYPVILPDEEDMPMVVGAETTTGSATGGATVTHPNLDTMRTVGAGAGVGASRETDDDIDEIMLGTPHGVGAKADSHRAAAELSTTYPRLLPRHAAQHGRSPGNADKGDIVSPAILSAVRQAVTSAQLRQRPSTSQQQNTPTVQVGPMNIQEASRVLSHMSSTARTPVMQQQGTTPHSGRTLDSVTEAAGLRGEEEEKEDDGDEPGDEDVEEDSEGEESTLDSSDYD